jgi:hypothetical protein
MHAQSRAAGRQRSRHLRGARRAALAVLLAPSLAAGLLPLAPAALAQAATAAAEIYPVPSSGVFELEGRGYGHGRGMSQWGAQGAATLGVSSTQILSTYYPGTAQVARPEDPARRLRVVLTGAGTEGRPPGGSPATDHRYSCDAAGARACDLEVLPQSGLALRAGNGRDEVLPQTLAVPGGSAQVSSWSVVHDGQGQMFVRGWAGGGWRPHWIAGSHNHTAPLTFTAPGPLRMLHEDRSVRDYRGTLTAVLTSAATMARVNAVAREDYLRSVVPKEVSPSWGAAALEAQTVAARSYAENYRGSRPAGSVWDICDSTWCQVYAGLAYQPAGGARVVQEAASTDAAIAATRDRVLTYGGAIIRAEYSASNGGWSVAGGEAFMPARPDPWDGVVGNPPNTSHRWTGALPASALEARFPAVGRLTALVVLSRDGNGEWGGRVLDVELRGVGSGGAPTSVRTTGDAVRSAWPLAAGRPQGLRSSWWRAGQVAVPELGGAWTAPDGSSELAWRRPDGSVALGTWRWGATAVSDEVSLGGAVRGGPAVVGRASGGREVFAWGADDQLWTRARSAGGAWGAWTPMGGVLRSSPAVTVWDDRVHLVVVGVDGAVWHRWSWAPGAWSGWEPVEGAVPLGTLPAITSVGPSELHVVVQGVDGQGWLRSWRGGWRPWAPLGGRLAGGASTASAAGELTVAVRGTDRAGHSRTGTTGWGVLGGQLMAAPVLTARPGSGRAALFGVGLDGGFYVTTRTAAGWTGWGRLGAPQGEPVRQLGGAWTAPDGSSELAWRRPDGSVALGTWRWGATAVSDEVSLGGAVRGGPAVVGRASGGREVFAWGADDQLWTRARSAGGAWGAWTPMGGVLRSSPAVTVWDDRVHLVVVGVDGAVWHRWSWAPGAWSGWEPVEGAVPLGTLPAITSVGPSELHVVVQGVDGQGWLRSWRGGWRPWAPLGGRLAGGASTASAAGELTVAVRGTDRAGHSRTGTTGWGVLGGQLMAAPVLTARPGSGRAALFGVGLDGGFYVTTRTAAGWTGWGRLG